MEGFDRRKFLKGSSVAAGLAGAMTVIPGALPALARTPDNAKASAAARNMQTDDEVSASEPVVAHIRDASKGQIDLFVGTKHITVQDRGLAKQILGAAR
jgi:hypothetical protein